MPDTIIKVFIVDDHLIVRQGVTSLLEVFKDIQIVGQASNANDTLSQIGLLMPDIILMDLRMPGVDGIQLTKMAKEQLPSCKVIVLTLYDQYVAEAMKAGARGYLLKDIPLENLIDSIRRVYSGEEVIDKNIRPTIKIDYEDESKLEKKDSQAIAAGYTLEDTSTRLFDQVRVFILPPADIGATLRLTSVLEEALAGDFMRVEGTSMVGISVTFNLSRSLTNREINARVSSVFDLNIKVFSYNELAQIGDLQNLMKKQHQFDLKHPSVKSVFVKILS